MGSPVSFTEGKHVVNSGTIYLRDQDVVLSLLSILGADKEEGR